MARTRSAVLANVLETERDLDFNGVILLSQILNFDFSADQPKFNPGVELPYQLPLPIYRSRVSPKLKALRNSRLLTSVELFLAQYAQALAAGPVLTLTRPIAKLIHLADGLIEW